MKKVACVGLTVLLPTLCLLLYTILPYKMSSTHDAFVPTPHSHALPKPAFTGTTPSEVDRATTQAPPLATWTDTPYKVSGGDRLDRPSPARSGFAPAAEVHVPANVQAPAQPDSGSSRGHTPPMHSDVRDAMPGTNDATYVMHDAGTNSATRDDTHEMSSDVMRATHEAVGFKHPKEYELPPPLGNCTWPHERFIFVCVSYGRHNNQLIELAKSWSLAYHTNRTLVLPKFYRKFMNDEGTRPTQEFYNISGPVRMVC